MAERARKLAESLRKCEAYHQAAEEIHVDRSFAMVIRRVAEESLLLQQNHHSDEGSSLSSLQEAESILQMLATGDGDSELFSAIESDSDDEQNAQWNYHSSQDTPNGPEDEELDNIPTPEPEITKPESPDKTTGTNQQEDERVPKPPPSHQRNKRNEFRHHHSGHRRNKRSEFQCHQCSSREITKKDH